MIRISAEKLPGLGILSLMLIIFWFGFGLLFWLTAAKTIPPHPGLPSEIMFFVLGSAFSVTLMVGYWAMMRGAEDLPLVIIMRLGMIAVSIVVTIIFYQIMMGHLVLSGRQPVATQETACLAGLLICLFLVETLVNAIKRITPERRVIHVPKQSA